MTLARPAALASALLATALLLAACGGGDSDDATATPTAAAGTPAATATASPTATPTAQPSEAMTVASADGMLTVEISAGAAAAGVEVEVTRIADEDLPTELRGADAVVLGYELGPDGAQFSEPVALTFRIDPTEHGLDLPPGAVPLGLLLTRNAAGELESIEGATLSREGELLVARGTVTHFTPAIFVLDNNLAILLEPSRIELAVGDFRQVEVIFRDLGTGRTIAFIAGVGHAFSEWTTTPPFEVAYDGPQADISCTAPTGDWVLGAYRVFIPTAATDAVRVLQLEMRSLFGAYSSALGVRLAGDGKCNGSSEATETTTEPADGEAVAVGGGSGEEVPDDSESDDSAGDADSPPEPPPADESGTGSTSSFVFEGNGVTMTVSAPDEATAGESYRVQVSIRGPGGEPLSGEVFCTLARKGDPDARHDSFLLSSDGTAMLAIQVPDSWKSGDEVALFCFFEGLGEDAVFVTSFFLE